MMAPDVLFTQPAAVSPDHWDSHETSQLLADAQPKYRWALEWVNRGRVLDLGCNDGALARRLKDSGVAAIGADRYPYVHVARQTYAIPVVALDAERRLPFLDASFDAVIVSGLLEYVRNPAGVLEEVHRVLRPGGRLVLIATNRNRIRAKIRRHRRQPIPEDRYTLREWKTMLDAAAFPVLEIRSCPYKERSGRARLVYWLERLWPSRWASDFAFLCELADHSAATAAGTGS